MSDTPRVDAGAEYWLEPGLRSECEIVNAEFARTLERELNAAKDQVEKDFPPEPEYTAWVEAGKPDVARVVKERDAARKALLECMEYVWCKDGRCGTRYDETAWPEEYDRWCKAAGLENP